MTPTDRIIALLTAKCEEKRAELDNPTSPLQLAHFKVWIGENGWPYGVSLDQQEAPPARDKRRLGVVR